MDLLERFWRKVRKTDGCWEWTASFRGLGYGQIKVNQKMLYAHRVSWEMANGPIPDGLCVLHHCDNPPCVNPDHLFLGTQADNMRDKVRKNRQGFPWKVAPCHHEEMRKLKSRGLPPMDIGKAYGLSQSRVYAIISKMEAVA
jgi:hypothetical protein